jgi:hypothetical protein
LDVQVGWGMGRWEQVEQLRAEQGGHGLAEGRYLGDGVRAIKYSCVGVE